MKREVTWIPKDKCPLDFIAEMGERTKNAWLYLHSNVIRKLRESDETYCGMGEDDSLIFGWDATNDHPETKITVTYDYIAKWHIVEEIAAVDIAFKNRKKDFDEIFFLKMEE